MVAFVLIAALASTSCRVSATTADSLLELPRPPIVERGAPDSVPEWSCGCRSECMMHTVRNVSFRHATGKQ